MNGIIEIVKREEPPSTERPNPPLTGEYKRVSYIRKAAPLPTKGLRQQLIPIKLENYTDEDIQRIQDWINHYPRAIHGWKCSEEV